MTDEAHHQVFHIQTPWWQRAWWAVTVLLAVVTLFLFALGGWFRASEARSDADYLRVQLSEVRAEQSVTRGEQACRSARSAAAINAQGDLLKNMSDLVGFLAARQPDQVPALMEERQRLSAAYAAAREQLATSVAACRDGAGG